MTPHQQKPHAQATPFNRPVSPTEWLYLASRRLGADMVLQLLVEGEGTPDPERLRAAVVQASDACPGSRLVRCGRVWQDNGRPPPVRFLPATDATDATYTADATDVAAIEVETGASCEVVVLPGSGDRPTTLAFRVFHGVMDGHGALTWMTEVFRALRGERPRPAHGTETDYTLLARLGATGRRPALLLDQPSPLAPANGPRGAADRQALWRRRTLPGHQPALTARLARAMADATGADRARIMIPVDLRRHLPDLASTANLTLPVFLELVANEQWPAAQAQLLRALAERSELAAGLEAGLARLPLRAAGTLLRAGRFAADRRDRHLASAIVSHLGRIDLDGCSGGGFTATSVYALPVHAPLVPVSCVAVETPAGTELTVGFQGGAGLVERAEALLDRLVEALYGTPPVLVREPQPEPEPEPEPAPEPRTTVVRLFRDQVARTPDAPALDGPEGVISYAELDRRSDAIAAELLRRGVGAEDPVGLVVERSPAGVAGLWGILKAGAAYLPLDPAHPDARITQVLGEAGSRLCLTQRHLLDRIGTVAPCPVLAAEDVPGAAHGTRLPEPDPSGLAYVIHTSGSTGRPKGVQIEHRSLVGLLRWTSPLCQVNAGTRFAFLSSYAFDISCFSLFLPMLAGGTTVLLPGEPTRTALHALLHQYRTNTLAVTPSHLDLAERFDLEPGGLRTLLVGGERFTRTAAERARRRFGPDCRIINAYGPTEATVGCLAHVVDGGETGPSVPIGHPGPYAQVELTDDDGKVIRRDEAGRIGEIAISGLQLARGYLGRPDLNAASFPVRPDGTRTYRTGDLGRRLPDGGIEFIGRNDDQIKIAGHRIEPAEVETVLERHPRVRRAAVTVRPRPGGGGPALCAYVLTESQDDSEEGTERATQRASDGPGLGALLRDDLAARLPAYLVPAVVLPVDELPGTVSGKTDFEALPDPFGTAGPGEAGDGSDRAPLTVEDRVAGLWASALGVDRALLTPDSDFLKLGGDSLAVLEMLYAVASELLEPHQEQDFMDRLDHILRDLTLQRVGAAVLRVRGAGDGSMPSRTGVTA